MKLELYENSEFPIIWTALRDQTEVNSSRYPIVHARLSIREFEKSQKRKVYVRFDYLKTSEQGEEADAAIKTAIDEMVNEITYNFGPFIFCINDEFFKSFILPGVTRRSPQLAGLTPLIDD